MNNFTKNQIENMPAGREMDKIIAEEIMGLKLWYGDPTGFNIPENIDYWRTDTRDSDDELCFRCPFYSTDISATWKVVEQINKKLSVRLVSYYQSDCLANMWDVRDFDKSFMARGDTCPLALCRAALLATLINLDKH
jgi:hypothetical protein